MNLKSLFSKCFGKLRSVPEVKEVVEEVKPDNFIYAGLTELGTLYVDVDQTTIVKKDDQYYLAVCAKEKYSNNKFLKMFLKNENLKNVVGAFHIFLFDNICSSYCVAANYLIDKDDNMCLDYGANMNVKELTAKDTAMLNAYTLCLKALELKQNEQNADA